jgi:hypothetical protein
MKHISANLSPKLAALAKRARATVTLADRVRAALAGPEKSHVVSASYRDETLVVLTDSAAWAVHIRLAQDHLLASVSSEGETQFTKLKVRVASPESATP